MRTLLSALLLFAHFSTFAAEQVVTTQPTQEKTYAANGFQFQIFKPFYKIKSEEKTAFVTVVSEPEVDSAIGFAVGYAYLPIQDVGVTAKISASKITERTLKLDDTIVRLEGNLGVAANKLLYFTGGLNVSTLSDNELDLDPSIGLQAGMGLQFTKNFGLHVQYALMSQNKENESNGLTTYEYLVTARGFEAALTATF